MITTLVLSNVEYIEMLPLYKRVSVTILIHPKKAQQKLLTSRLANLIFILSVSTIYNNTESLPPIFFFIQFG